LVRDVGLEPGTREAALFEQQGIGHNTAGERRGLSPGARNDSGSAALGEGTNGKD